MELLIKKLVADAEIPRYMTDGAVAFDIQSIDYYTVYRTVTMIHTGLAFAIPEGYEISIRPRSGLSLMYPNYIANSPGTIDSDYRGEIVVPVINLTESKWEIAKGDRIAQCIVSEVARCYFKEVDKLPKTERDAGGFGHTGV